MRTLRATIFLASALLLTQAISMPIGARGQGHDASAYHGKNLTKYAANTRANKPELIIDFIFNKHKVQRKKAHVKKRTRRRLNPVGRWKLREPTNIYMRMDPRNLSGGG